MTAPHEGDLNISHVIEAEDISRLRDLLDAEPPRANERFVDEQCPLHTAVRVGNPEIVQVLFQYGADPNCRDMNGRTPLHEAGELGRPEIAQTLLQHGAVCDARDELGFSPLNVAAGNYSSAGQAVANLLLEHGARLDLYSAVSLGRVQAVRQMLDAEAGVQDYPIGVLLTQAISARSPAVLELLLGRNPSVADVDLVSLMLRSIDFNELGLVEVLLRHGVRPDAKMRGRHTTVIDYARKHGASPAILDLLGGHTV